MLQKLKIQGYSDLIERKEGVVSAFGDVGSEENREKRDSKQVENFWINNGRRRVT